MNLDILEEVWEYAMVRMVSYQQKVAQYHNVQVRGKFFEATDLVLQWA